MKKILIILCSVLLLSACSTKEKIDGLPNPIVEYNSLDEINNVIGSKLFKMPVMGVSNETYVVINDEIAEYTFDLNGYTYTFRASKNDNHDISGVYDGSKLIFENNDEDNGFYYGENRKDFFLNVGEYRYNMDVEDNGELSKDTFYNVFDEVSSILYETYADPELLELVGSYQDSYSMRAMMEVSLYTEDSLFFEITWSSSALEYDFFSMEVKEDDGKLEYEMGVHYRVSDGDVMNATFFTDYAKGGYFTVQDGKIMWNGSGVELTDNCVFEKIVY